MEGLLFGNLLSRAGIFGGSGGSNIKSIQTGVYSGSFTSASVSISQVNKSKSFLIIDSVNGERTSPTTYGAVSGQIASNGLSVELTRGRNDSVSCTVIWVVIEFINVKSRQEGSVSRGLYSGTTSVIISAVNRLKCLVSTSFYQPSAQTTDSEDRYMANHLVPYLASDTQLTLYHSSNTNNTTYVYWNLIEFD